MQTVTAIYTSRSAAEAAFHELRSAGLSEQELSLLTPDNLNQQANAVPTTDGEQPGMGSAIGGVVGGAVGLSGGMQIATAISSVLVPGFGSVLAIGFAGAALAGAVGALGGAKAGQALEKSLSEGLPRDELYFYIEELKKGRSVIICRTDDNAKLELARRVLGASAQILDAARSQRGIGIGDAPGTATSKGR
jgi:outer membrane lipoprotein SlyB